MEIEMKEHRNEGPPRKRLLTDPNPKQRFITASPESTVSSDSSSDRVTKRTRELPNLSDCHSCSVRINYTNPRERLQPLDSMWRIVLLCKKCYKQVKSSQLCPYCFSSIVDVNDCFKCCDCQHSVHKDCVEKYGSGLGFSVCVDCWVPDAVVNSIRARKRKCRKKNNEPESRVAVGEIVESNSLGEEVERKVAAAAKASENALRKAVVAKNAVGLAKGVLNIVASRKVVGSCETEVVDDKKLAVMLHRAINSSPRTSRYACLMSSFRGDGEQITCYSRKRVKKDVVMNSSGLDVPFMCYYRRRLKSGLKKSTSLDHAPSMRCYERRSSSNACSHDRECECFICKVSKSIDKHVSNCGSSSENGFNGNKCQENDVGIIDTNPHRFLLKYYRIGKGVPRPLVFGKESDCGSCMDFANLITEDLSDTRDFGNDKKCPEICEKCDDNTNRFLLKYKRTKKITPEVSCKFE